MRIAFACAIVCLWSCAQLAAESDLQRATRRASENPQDAQAQAEWIGARFVAGAGGDGGDTAEEGPVKLRRDKIQKELETLDKNGIWGVYYSGGGYSSMCLSIAPESGATYTFRGCMGLYDANHGDVVEVDGRTVRLDLAINPKRNRRWYPDGSTHPVMSAEWCVVDWGDLRFMIPSSQMIPFCNDVNFGNIVRYPCRTVGEEKNERPPGTWTYRGWARPDGLPDVPNEYRPFLLTSPIRAAILRTEDPIEFDKYYGGEPMLRVVADIDGGRSAGLLPGMTLSSETGREVLAEVIAVQDSTARVRMHSSAGNFPSTGSILTTLSPSPW